VTERKVVYATFGLLTSGAAGAGAGVVAGRGCAAGGGIDEEAGGVGVETSGGGADVEVEVEVEESAVVEVALMRILPPAGTEPLEPAVYESVGTEAADGAGASVGAAAPLTGIIAGAGPRWIGLLPGSLS